MSYRQMANVYDHLMKHAPYKEWVNFTEEIFSQSGHEIKQIADLGCGTGEITIALAQKGYEMTGVDYSEDMLAYAEHKAMQRNVNIQWLNQDLRQLEGISHLDAAISYCDVLNYITEPEDLQNVFHHVHDSLKPGGLFLFDVHDINYITHHYINHTFADVTDDISYIWFCLPGEEPGEMYHELTFFNLQDGKYERFDEEHHQRTYPVQFYKDLLNAAGFENIKVYADFSLKLNNVKENSKRIFFSASKGSR